MNHIKRLAGKVYGAYVLYDKFTEFIFNYAWLKGDT